MSRIQNILEKAERDGTVRTIHGLAEAASAVGPPLPVDPAPFAAPSLDLIENTAPRVAPVPQPAPGRVVSNVRLHPHLVTVLSAGHIATEQYRAVRTRMLHADNGTSVNIVLVTSPGRGDGRSMTAANLGLTIAQEAQRRVCVVDADLRQPQQHWLFGLPEGPGLADLLADQASLDETLTTIEECQLTILPAGTATAHPAELLGTTTMRRTLDLLRSRFDCIVIDAPAALPLADVGILTPLVDSVVMVVRAGVTSKPAIYDAVAAIDNAKLLGIVLNQAA